jgi:hypothetical protein
MIMATQIITGMGLKPHSPSCEQATHTEG